MARSLLPLLVFVGLFTPVMVSGRSSPTAPRGAPKFSLLMGHLKSREASTVQSQGDIYLSATISFPSV